MVLGAGVTSDLQTPELLSRMQAGDEAALGALYDEFSGLAFSVAFQILRRREAAEDCAQDAFLKVWDNADKFDASRGSFGPWFCRIVHNLAIDMVRRERRLVPSDTQADLALWADQSGSGEHLVLDRMVVEEGFAALPEEQRQVLQLSYFDGLKIREIAEQMQIPEGTVKSRMRLGLERMRQTLQEKAGC